MLGDISAQEITPKLETLLASWTGAGTKPPELAAAGRDQGTHASSWSTAPNSVQTAFYLGNHAYRSPEPRLHPGAGAEPRARRRSGVAPVPQHPRGKGYTYGISSGFSATRYLNHFASQTSVRTEVTGDALREMLKEFADIRTRLVPADELENAKRALVASFALSTENPGTALSNATQIKEYGLPADYWDTYPEKIAAVTAADVQRVAQKYIPLDDIVIVAVGDAAKIRAVLAEFGTIEEWDAEGKRVASN